MGRRGSGWHGRWLFAASTCSRVWPLRFNVAPTHLRAGVRTGAGFMVEFTMINTLLRAHVEDGGGGAS
jgi:hypothetical protein